MGEGMSEVTPKQRLIKTAEKITERCHSPGYYLALVQEYEKSENLYPALLYYGDYEHEIPWDISEEEAKANLEPNQVMSGTTIFGVGFHQEIEQISGEHDFMVKVFHFDKFPKIIELSPLPAEFHARKI